VGKHTLYFRLTSKEPWQFGGQFLFKPGHDYDVDVSESGLRLTPKKK